MADKYAQLWAIFSFYFYVHAEILHDDDDDFSIIRMWLHLLYNKGTWKGFKYITCQLGVWRGMEPWDAMLPN